MYQLGCRNDTRSRSKMRSAGKVSICGTLCHEARNAGSWDTYSDVWGRNVVLDSHLYLE